MPENGYRPSAMPLLLAKLIVTPLLIGAASLAARRWGPAVAGWLVALPLTSGPVVVYVALEHGIPFGTEVGLGVVAGGFALCVYAVAYARSAAANLGPLASCAIASAGFVVAGVVVDILDPGSLGPLAIGVALAMAAAVRLVPAARSGRGARPPAWDLPARMLVGTLLVVGVSALAPALGARVSGLAATYPVYVSTLTVFAHRADGPMAARALLRGLVLGLFGWLGFFVVLLAAMPVIGIAPSFVAAVAGAFAIQGLSFRRMGGLLGPAEQAALAQESVP